MTVFAVLLFVPTLVILGSFLLSQKITVKEIALQFGLQVFIAGIAAAIVFCSNTADVEIWNGEVVNKERVRVSCSHSYPCNPHPCGCDSKGNCSTCWDTCYHHSYDVDWDVYTSNKETVTIDRVDWQGLEQPPRWTAIRMGEPTAVRHRYDNYIKASPDSLFRHQGLKEKYTKFIPEYPNSIHDYYKLNRVVLVNGATIPDPAEWNAKLSRLNASLGAKKQVNMVVVLVKNLPNDYFYGLEEAWIGGKKNDVIAVVGVDSELKPTWTEVMAWAGDPIVKVKIRDGFMEQVDGLTLPAVIDIMHRNVTTHYQRKPMKDFEYLQASITPTFWEWTVALLISVLAAAGLSWASHVHDIFGDERRQMMWKY